APLGPELRRFIHTVDPRLPVPTVATMESVMHADLSSVRFRTWLLSLFAATALLLAVVGLFGVLSYAVARRTREIGIRMALGAGASRVRALVVRQGMTPAVIGLCVGLVGSLASARLLASLFRGIGPVDPLTMGIVAAMVLASALLASYLPARRATAVDPVTALRSE
ncbi:MAG TPA: FtsX-like permease family protein, partial [Gemmatimonadaceae bacterium]|nr:FtsX-like permease family protein [Gemmatimonadaceae bacterium]